MLGLARSLAHAAFYATLAVAAVTYMVVPWGEYGGRWVTSVLAIPDFDAEREKRRMQAEGVIRATREGDLDELRIHIFGTQATLPDGPTEPDPPQPPTKPATLTIEMEKTMQMGTSYLVTVAVEARAEDGATPALDRTADAFEAPTALKEPVELASLAKVSMLAGEFEVTAVKSGWQKVVAGAASHWVWRISPTAPGDDVPFLFWLEHHPDREPQSEPESAGWPVAIYNHSVKVEATWLYYAQRASEFVWSNIVFVAIIAGFFGTVHGGIAFFEWLTEKIRARRKPKAL